MEFYRIWRILLGHLWLVIGLPVVATAVGLSLTYVLPEQYESTALVLVRPLQTIKFDTGGSDRKELLNFPVSEAAPIDAAGKTYIEVIKSPTLVMKIVEALHLDVIPPVDEASLSLKDRLKRWVKDTIRTGRNYFKYGRDISATPFELAVEDVDGNLTAAVRKDTYAFDISYRSGDPQRAADVANMAATMFLEQSSETYRREAARTRAFIDAQADDSRKTFDQARAAVLAYQSTGGGFDPKSEYEQQLKNVADLENTLAKAQGKTASLKRMNGAANPFVTASEAEIAELKDQIATLHTQLAAYPKKAGQLDSLTLAMRLAQDNYEFFLKRATEARLRESSASNEIRIISRAIPTLYPLKPVKYIYAGLSFAMALAVAIGWALFSEYLDPRVRTIRGLDDEFGIPVLGAVPMLKRSWGRVTLASSPTSAAALGSGTMLRPTRRLAGERAAE